MAENHQENCSLKRKVAQDVQGTMDFFLGLDEN